MNVKILPRPVVSLYRIDGNVFISQQRCQVFTRCAADGKDRVALPPRKVMARATLIPPPPGSNTGRYSVACLPGKFAGLRGAVERGGLT
jgi:hypothetical protein